MLTVACRHTSFPSHALINYFRVFSSTQLHTLARHAASNALLAAWSACTLAAQARATPKRATQACEPRWSAPEIIETPFGERVFVQNPDAIRLGNTSILLGMPTFIWPDSASARIRLAQYAASPSADTGYLVGLQYEAASTARMIVSLRSDGVMRWPRTFPGGKVANVVWGQSDGPTPIPIDPTTPITAIHHATFDGKAWSRPRVVATAEHLRPHHGIAAEIEWREKYLLAAPALDNRNGAAHAGVMVVSYNGSEWRTSWIETPPLWPGAVAAAGDGTSQVVAFTGTMDDSLSRRVTGVYVTRSTDFGSTWSKPVLAWSRPAGADTQYPRLVMLQNPRRFHLLWVEFARPQPGQLLPAAMLQHGRSSDGGQSWAPAQSFALDESTDVLDLAPVNDTEFVVVTRAPITNRLAVARWSGAGWSSISHPFAEPAFSVPTTSRPRPGALEMIWSINAVPSRFAPTSERAPALVRSTLAECR